VCLASANRLRFETGTRALLIADRAVQTKFSRADDDVDVIAVKQRTM